MTPFWGTETFAFGTKVGAHFGRQDGPNLGARSPFCESAFRGAGAGGRVPIRPWCGSLGVVSVGCGNPFFLFRPLFEHCHTPCNGEDPRIWTSIFGAQNENHKVHEIVKFVNAHTVLLV